MIRVELPGPETIDDDARVSVNLPFEPVPLPGSKAWAQAREMTIDAVMEKAKERGVFAGREGAKLASTRCESGHLHIIAILRGPVSDA